MVQWLIIAAGLISAVVLAFFVLRIFVAAAKAPASPHRAAVPSLDAARRKKRAKSRFVTTAANQTVIKY